MAGTPTREPRGAGTQAFPAGTLLARPGGVETPDDDLLVKLALLKAELAALKTDLEALRKDMVMVRQGVGILLTRRH